jgi:hypothetical protein
MIQSPRGLEFLNPKKPLNVAMAMKNDMPKTAKQLSRKSYKPRKFLVRSLTEEMRKERPHP